MKTCSKASSLHQEVVNNVSNGIGGLFGLICIPLLIKKKVGAGITSTCLYGFELLMVFTFSTLYHSFQQPEVKQLLKIFGHISIYFLIAGAYAQLIIIFVNNQFGVSILLALWSLKILGINFKSSFAGKLDILSTGIYFLMGYFYWQEAKLSLQQCPQ